MFALTGYAGLMLIVPVFASQIQPHTQTAAERLSVNFADVNRKILAMAKDFPPDKYNFRLKPEMRSFGEVMVHIVSALPTRRKRGAARKSNGTSLTQRTTRGKPRWSH
jgi:hypothetical protein